MARWQSAAGVLLVAGALSVAGCGPPGGGPWAAEAEAWFEGYDEASDAKAFEQAIYFAADAVDDTVMAGRNYYAVGRRNVVQLASLTYGWDFRPGPLYLGQSGAVRTDAFTYEGVGVWLMLAHVQIGEDGIERSTHLAPTWMDWTLSLRQGEAIAHAEEIAADYMRAWRTGDPALVRQLYSADATLSDDLLGLSAQGGDAIAEAAAASGPIVAATNAEVLPPLTLAAEPNPDPDAPAVFLHLDLDHPERPTQVWVFVASQDPCPGSSVVALQVDDQQRVTAEQRYRAVASMRGCLEPDRAPTGWWTGRDLPLPFGERVTGSVETPAGSVEIRNGTADVDAVVAWGFGRFAASGLPAPAVSSITFDPFDDRCNSFKGYADWGDGTTAILVCFDSSGIGPPQVQDDAEALPDLGGPGADLPQQGHLLLHELGHAWVADHTDDTVREEFLAQTGLDNWNDKGRPWNRRGAEWAAETVAWGLQGSASTSVPLGSPDCALLADGYRTLTGAEPLTPCPAEG